jgi:hypothetical protein
MNRAFLRGSPTSPACRLLVLPAVGTNDALSASGSPAFPPAPALLAIVAARQLRPPVGSVRDLICRHHSFVYISGTANFFDRIAISKSTESGAQQRLSATGFSYMHVMGL